MIISISTLFACATFFPYVFAKTDASSASIHNASIPYTDESMNCVNCIRGGYDFCFF